MYSIDAISLARYVIWYANQKEIKITALKLQKLLYYLQMESLRIFGRELFSDKIEAWQYGPVVRSVYVEFCKNGAMPLFAQESDGTLCNVLLDEVKQMIDSVLDKLLAYPARQLVQMTHEEAPWKQLKGRVDCGEKPEITVKSMREALGSEGYVR